MSIYISISLFFKSHFYLGTTINGINISGKTIEQAEKKVIEEIGAYKITLEEKNNITENIKGKEFNLEYIKTDFFENIIRNQNSSAWIFRILKNNHYVYDKIFTYDTTLLKECFGKLECLNEEKVIKPKSASLNFNGNEYEIINEIYGNKVNKDKLLDEIKKSIKKGQLKINLGEINCYEKPKYNSTSLELIEAKKICDKYVSSKIVYTFDEVMENIDGNLICNWIIVYDDLKVKINEEKVKEYISDLCRKYDTYGKTRLITTSVGKSVEVKGGNYGFKIDKSKEIRELIYNIENGYSVVKEPEYIQKAEVRGEDDIGKTYVEVNITRQHLWFYKDGKLITQGDVVTGNAQKGWKTPNGTYRLNYKQMDAVLRGENYASKVKYWMPFNGNIGLHDASWRGAFGGNIYNNDGTHGCVNLPKYLAKKIFENIEEGVPVICYTE